MGDEGSENTKWAKDIYWGHFQHIHFSQFLPHGFDQQLAIPKKFSDNLRKKLPDSVTLKGPSGNTWMVGVTAIDESMFFKQGWQDFVNDHPLAENDLLVFKYNNESAFEVLIFDGKNLCEKEYSYFVKKAEKSKQEPESSLIKCKIKRSAICDEIINATSSENLDSVSPEKSRDDDSVIILSREQIVALDSSRKLTPIRSKRRRRGSALFTRTPPTPSDLQLVSNPSTGHTPTPTPTPTVTATPTPTPTASRIIGDSGSAKKTRWRRKGYGHFYSSNRRNVTEDEQANALLLAQAAMSESGSEGLLVVLKPSHVYKRFFVIIPTEWVSKFTNLENQDLFVRFREKEWRTRFNYNRVRDSAGISSGWKYFSIDNNLEKSDVVLFELGCPVNNSLCFDVKIFRVVPEITPLTRIAACAQPKKIKDKNKCDLEDQEEEDEEEEEEEEEEYGEEYIRGVIGRATQLIQ